MKYSVILPNPGKAARRWRKTIQLLTTCYGKGHNIIIQSMNWTSVFTMFSKSCLVLKPSCSFHSYSSTVIIDGWFPNMARHQFTWRCHETFLHPESGFSNAMCWALEACRAFATEHLWKSHFLTKRGLQYSCFSPALRPCCHEIWPE